VAVTMEQVKELRDRTGAAILDCKKVLEQTNGDMQQALQLMRNRGLEIAAKKQHRETSEGRVEVYVHHSSKIAAIVELNCETDFVARNDEFIQLARDIAIHIAGANPRFLRKEVTDEAVQAALRESEVESADEFVKQYVLLEQPFVRQPNVTIGQRVQETIAKTGENINVRRFARWEVGA
jgi:elongation factor Ts